MGFEKSFHFGVLDTTKSFMTESFNMPISHQLFDYTITSENLQYKNTNSKGDFVLKIQVCLKDLKHKKSE